jgi:hypothetical protein
MLNQVFLSYSHESLEHARVVRRLGQLLREAKIPVALDQFFLDEHPGGPDEGWPKWCANSANQSACVLIIGSEGWFAAYADTAGPSIGLGAASEATIIRHALREEKGRTTRTRLALLHSLSADMVPSPLRTFHQFRPFESSAELDELIWWIADCLGLHHILPPTVQWPEPAPFQPDLADRIEEWRAIVDLLAGRSRQRILLYQGGTGLGKSELLRQAVKYAREIVRLPVVFVNFSGGGFDISNILGQFDLELSAQLPNFSREGAGRTHLLRKDLRAMRTPALLMFDTYELAADSQTVVDWLNLQLLPEVETSLGLAVIVAGQKVPDRTGAAWRDLSRQILLNPIAELEHWESWIAGRYPAFRSKGADLATVLMIANGNPAVVRTACSAIAGELNEP